MMKREPMIDKTDMIRSDTFTASICCPVSGRLVMLAVVKERRRSVATRA